MKLYVAAVAVALASVSLIASTCMFRDNGSRHAPVTIAHLR